MSPHTAIYVDIFPDCVLPAFPSNGNVTCGNLHPEGNEYRLIYGQVSISPNCFSSSLMMWPNKLEPDVLALATFGLFALPTIIKSLLVKTL
jgi:hypothetical protein